VKGPGIKAGSRARGNVYLLDVLATLCDIASIEAPKTSEGTSFWPVLKGTRDIVRKNLYGAYCGGAKPGMRSIRSGDWKLIKYESSKDGIQKTQLFNLADNPDELLLEHHQGTLTTLMGRSPESFQKNLADDPEHVKKRKELENLLLAEMRRLDDPYRLWDQPDDGLPIPETRNPDPKEKKSKRKKNK
jgi:arylsulfatase A-like enzyme